MARSVYYFTDSVEVGGAEQALLLLVGHLDRARWRPTVLYHEADATAPFAAAAVELGAEVRAVPRLPNGVEGARRVPALARAVHAGGADVFHAHLTWPFAAKYALVAAVVARVPAVVATVHLFPEFTWTRSTFAQQRLLAAAVDR